MAITMKEKYDSIIMSKLPESFQDELKGIKTDTKDFNPKFVPIEQKNFDFLYDLIEKEHPEALQKGGKIKKVRATKVKKVKPKAEKKEMVHKSRGKSPISGARALPILKHGGGEFYVDFRLEEIRPVKGLPTPIKFATLNADTKAKLRGIRAEFGPNVHIPSIDAEEKKESKGGDSIEDCRKVLTEAGYTTKKKLSKDGKKAIKAKEPRPERTIIKDKVDGVFTTILKEVSGSKEKDEKYANMQKQLNKAQTLLTKLFQMLNNLAEDNSTDKVEKIVSLLEKIVP